jgi:hypothetical protein
MAEVQDFTEVYIELCERMAEKMPHINHQDLWHEQVGFLEDEHPFEGPALFYEFRGIDDEELGELVQRLDLQIDVYLFYETFLDTSHDSYNQGDAIAMLKDLSNINKYLHGYVGTAVDNISRLGFQRVQTGGAGNLYRVSFMAQTKDHSAVKEYDTAVPNEVNVNDNEIVDPVARESNFRL